MVLALYGWAFLSLDRSSIARAMLWMGADVDDQHRFPARVIRAGDAVSSLPAAPEISVPEVPAGERGPFDRFLRDSDIADQLAKEADR